MKVTVIHGQEREGATYHVAHLIIDKLEDASIKEIFLPRDFNNFCLGCAQCFNEGENLCPHYNMLSSITVAIDEADVLIFTSPVHELHITGAMKMLLEHYAYRWLYHRPKAGMLKKQAVCVTTAAGMGVKSTNKELAENLSWWGIPKIYKLGIALHASSYDEANDSVKKKVDKYVKRIVKKINDNDVKVGIKTKMLFYLMRSIQNEKWSKINYSYWRENGWLEKKRPWKADE